MLGAQCRQMKTPRTASIVYFLPHSERKCRHPSTHSSLVSCRNYSVSCSHGFSSKSRSPVYRLPDNSCHCCSHCVSDPGIQTHDEETQQDATWTQGLAHHRESRRSVSCLVGMKNISVSVFNKITRILILKRCYSLEAGATFRV